VIQNSRLLLVVDIYGAMIARRDTVMQVLIASQLKNIQKCVKKVTVVRL